MERKESLLRINLKRIEKASDTYFKKPENDLASTIKAKKRGERK